MGSENVIRFYSSLKQKSFDSYSVQDWTQSRLQIRCALPEHKDSRTHPVQSGQGSQVVVHGEAVGEEDESGVAVAVHLSKEQLEDPGDDMRAGTLPRPAAGYPERYPLQSMPPR